MRQVGDKRQGSLHEEPKVDGHGVSRSRSLYVSDRAELGVRGLLSCIHHRGLSRAAEIGFPARLNELPSNFRGVK